jgi:hypothetical protein
MIEPSFPTSLFVGNLTQMPVLGSIVELAFPSLERRSSYGFNTVTLVGTLGRNVRSDSWPDHLGQGHICVPKYWMEAAANIWATGSGTIRDLGLEYHIVFNKGAVMVLPPGTNKATGLKAALADLDLSTRSVIGIGDAENDFAFLEACGCSAAVGNATPALKNTVDVVLEGCWGRGVVELIEQIIAKDAGIIPTGRHGIRVGIDPTATKSGSCPMREAY